jgi:hypothetical protein
MPSKRSLLRCCRRARINGAALEAVVQAVALVLVQISRSYTHTSPVGDAAGAKQAVL